MWNLLHIYHQLLLVISPKEFKYGYDNKNCREFGIEYKYCEFCLQYIKVNEDLIEYKCFYCNKSYQNKFDDFKDFDKFDKYKT